MKKEIYLTGATGFVGRYFRHCLSDEYKVNQYERGAEIKIQESIVLHFAGKAHDLKNVSDFLDYYRVNTDFSKDVFNSFLESDAEVFIFLSSVKAAADRVEGVLTEEKVPEPKTHYGISKLLAEKYMLAQVIPENKRVYILRPCMIHGPGNKGNLNLLFKLVSFGVPWPLGSFNNKRSFCSIDNLMFVIKELFERRDIPSGVYNIADNDLLSTNDLISIIAQSINRRLIIWRVAPSLVYGLFLLAEKFQLPFKLDMLNKLTDSYVVSNVKIISAIGRDLPVSARDGLLKTFKSFAQNVE